MAVSPTAEGFRAAFRRPSFAMAEIAWRWVVGATATALFFFGLFEYLDTLPVTNGELLFLHSRQPFLVWQAILHILRGSMARGVLSLMLAAMLVALLWMMAASMGRVATVRALIDYFRECIPKYLSDRDIANPGMRDVAGNVSTNGVALFRINFLRVIVVLAALLGIIAAIILASFVSSDADPQPGLAFLLFLPLAALVCLIVGALNWLLSLAEIFPVRDGEDAVGAISAAVSLCGEHTGAVLAVSAWTGMAHLVVFGAATTVASMVMGFGPLLPWRLAVLGIFLVTLVYFAAVDWLYTARLAGYVCILELPEALRVPPPPVPPPLPPPPLQTTIDRDEPILSDIPGLAAEM